MEKLNIGALSVARVVDRRNEYNFVLDRNYLIKLAQKDQNICPNSLMRKLETFCICEGNHWLHLCPVCSSNYIVRSQYILILTVAPDV